MGRFSFFVFFHFSCLFLHRQAHLAIATAHRSKKKKRSHANMFSQQMVPDTHTTTTSNELKIRSSLLVSLAIPLTSHSLQLQTILDGRKFLFNLVSFQLVFFPRTSPSPSHADFAWRKAVLEPSATGKNHSWSCELTRPDDLGQVTGTTHASKCPLFLHSQPSGLELLVELQTHGVEPSADMLADVDFAFDVFELLLFLH